MPSILLPVGKLGPTVYIYYNAPPVSHGVLPASPAVHVNLEVDDRPRQA